MKDSTLIKQHYDDIINLAKKLFNKYSKYTTGWHDDICINYNGNLYHTGLVNSSISSDVFDGNAIVAFTVTSNTKMTLSQIKKQLHINIETAEAMEDLN